MKTDFGSWLRDEIQSRGMTQAELAQLSGITPAQISRIISGARGIGESSLQAIAKALRIPPLTVFRKAGLLPDAPEQNELLEAILHNAAQMTDEEQQELLEFILLKNRLRQEREEKARAKAAGSAKLRPAEG